MLRTALLLSFQSLLFTCVGQRVLHFTRTSGFDHATRSVSFAMFATIGTEIGVEVIDDADGSTFSDLFALDQFDVVIFANTSGNVILDPQQRANFEAWVAQGGNVMGIHAATDTYRHSSANGTDTGTWDLYAELIGGSVQTDPYHVTGTPSFALHHLVPHASTANLPDPWQKEEEYYYWENGYLHPGIVPVLEVEQTIGPNGEVNTYDVPRPMSWYRITDTGRVFYTALGHAATNYTDDMLFRTHVKDALIWLLEDATSIGTTIDTGITIAADPIGGSISISGLSDPSTHFQLIDPQGRLIKELGCTSSPCHLSIAGHPAGMYLLRSKAHVLKITVW